MSKNAPDPKELLRIHNKMKEESQDKIAMDVEEYKKGLLRSINIELGLAYGENDDYHVGLRNGLRICRAFIDGKTPDYE